MTEQFDPYRKWLGIPAQDQPPHHYRLLGIEPFESDPEVVCNAADARMAHVKTYQTGKHSDHSQRLLNELATAKICLLNPAKRAEYDRRLRERLEGREERGERRGEGDEENAPGQRSGGGVAEELDDFSSLVLPPRASDYIVRGRRKKQPSWLVPSIVFGALALLALVLAIAYQNGLADRGSKRNDPARKELPPVHAKNPAPASKPKPSRPQPTHPRAPRPAPPRREQEPPAKPDQPPVKAAHPQPAPIIEQPEPTEPPAEQPAHKPPAIRKKLAVPDAAAQHKAEVEIRKRFAQQFAAGDTIMGKLLLAARLRVEARAATEDPAARFVLYRLSGELAARAGKLSQGFTTIDLIAERFDVNPWAMKADLAETVVSGRRVAGDDADTIAQRWLQTETLRELADEAAAGDDLTTAVRAAKLAASTAKMTKDPLLIRDASARLRGMDYMKSRFRPVEAALAVLAENPADAEANLTVGRWRCFAIGDWKRGLPLLAKASDPALADLARRDLAEPAAVRDCLALADAWYAAAEKEPPPTKTGLLTRACYWYERVPPVVSGEDKARTSKRLDELHKKDIWGERIRGAMVIGDVALSRRGAKAEGPSAPEKMLDGFTATNEKDCSAYGKCPCRWVITLDKVYQLREIRFKLHDFNRKRAYRYVLSVSADGDHYTVVKDASRGEWRGWQQIFLSSRPVKTILLEGLYCTTGPDFAVIELEAYCIPPLGARPAGGSHR